MKFRYKVLLVNIIIIAITLSVSGFFIISRQNRLIMDSEIKNSVTENNLIESTLEYSLLDTINSSAQNVRSVLPTYASRVSSGMLASTTSLYVTYDSNIIYTSKGEQTSPSQTLLKNNTPGKRYQIVHENNKTFIYVMSSIYINDLIINIITKRNITNTMAMINNNISLYRLYIIVILLISGFIVYIISTFLTRPLEKLNTVTDTFAEGDFTTRSSISTHDEIGLLSEKFNHMADSVENHIVQLNDTLHRRDQFVADFTHEIKTPMTTIIGYADTIRSVELPREDEVKAASYIFSEGKRLEQMSSHLFDLIYLKDGEIPKTVINTQALGETVIDTIRPSLEKSQMNLISDIDSASIYGDSSLLKTVFINLLDNARKYSDNGEDIYFTGHIISSSSNKKDLYEFVVEDHGIGIAKEDIDKICDEFFMVDKSRSRKEGGAGLGMSLVSSILNEHSAQLKIESELGKGTKMKVIFPIYESFQDIN
ncbi:MAG: HAMP domain-containing histidine kinase [Eubacterium sp.]|nr:HAMP domain-containing histidine kinase [Eubacterium sp.]